MNAIGIKLLVILSMATFTVSPFRPAPFKGAAVSNVFQEDGAPAAVGIDPTLELVGYLGGISRSVVVQGRYVYLASGFELAILDLYTVPAPVRVSYFMFPEYVQDIQIAGDLAILVTNDYTSSHFVVLDISDPLSLRQIGSLAIPGVALRLALMEDVAYIAAGSAGLQIVNFSNPLSPSLVGSLDTPDWAQDIEVQWIYAYVADGGSGMHIIDISNPADPIQVGVYRSKWLAVAVKVRAGLAFVGDSHSALRIVNILNPAFPYEISGYDPGSDVTRDLALQGDYVFLMDSADGLYAYNISDPLHPRLDVHLSDLKSFRLAASSQRLYIPGFSGELTAFDISNPTHIVEAWYYASLGQSNTLAVSNGLAYIADELSLKVVDVSNSRFPAMIGFLDLSWTCCFNKVIVREDYVYLLTEHGLVIIDIADPTHPTQAGSFYFVDYVMTRDMAVNGKYVYVAYYGSYSSGIHILDISNPSAPVEIGSVLITWVNRVEILNNHLVTSGEELIVLNLDDPANPEEISRINTEGYGIDIDMQGSLAYLLIANCSLTCQTDFKIVDLSDPTQPTFIADLPVYTSTIDNIKIAEGFAFISDIPNESFLVVDISDPYNPYIHSQVNQIGVRDLAVGGSQIYAAGSGLFIFKHGYTLSGRITDAYGNPFPGVNVAISSTLQTTSASDGSFGFHHLPVGTYSLSPTVPGFITWPFAHSTELPPDFFTQSFILTPGPVTGTLAPDSMLEVVLTDTAGLRTTLAFPSGAVTSTVEVDFGGALAQPGPGMAVTHHAFNLQVVQDQVPQEDFTFHAPITATLEYQDADVAPLTAEDQAALYWWDGSDWQDASQTCPQGLVARDLDANRISVSICRSGSYALFGPSNIVHLPILMRYQ